MGGIRSWKELLVERYRSGTLGQTGEEHISLESWVRLTRGVVGILEARFELRPFERGDSHGTILLVRKASRLLTESFCRPLLGRRARSCWLRIPRRLSRQRRLET